VEHITCITMSNTNNPNKTSVYTSASPEAVGGILLENGWVEDGFTPGVFVKDRVIITVEQPLLVEGADVALNKLFFC